MTGCEAAVEPTGGSEERTATNSAPLSYGQDFFDNFDGTSLNYNNWQDQVVWVNNELQCYDNGYNENGGHRTLEVSNGTLKLRVIDTGTVSGCANWDKNGAQHPNTQYRGGRIASKNRVERIFGKWTARLHFYSWLWSGGYGQPTGVSGMFPAWWLLGGRNNESPVQEGDENVCWPLQGSGEIDILEHVAASGQNSYASRGVLNQGSCNGGDWWSRQLTFNGDLANFHEYQVESNGVDLIYRVDNNEVGRNWGVGQDYPDPMFAILNYALQANMAGNYKEYAMEIDWVKHEASPCALKANANGLYASARLDASGNPVRAQAGSIQGWEQFDIVDAGWGFVGLRSHANGLFVSANMNDGNKTLVAGWATSIGGWEQFTIVPQSNGWFALQSNANGLYVSADLNNPNAPLEAKWATSVGGWEQFQCQ
jgi:hypothetical protein